MKPVTLRLAAAALMAVAAPAFAQTCQVDPATPFSAGPVDPVSKFSQWVVDSNGVGLNLCLQGTGAPSAGNYCFYDPVQTSSPLSVLLGRGPEAFWFLADSVFSIPDTTAALTARRENPLNATIVMGVESAFLSPVVQDGFQTQFQRLRIRIDVNAVGIYTVEHPWGSKTYRVDTLLEPGNGQNRSEISDPVDITFNSGASAAGLVTPFLRWDPAQAPAAPAGFLGDALTPHRVVGSPCGKNYIRITAVGLDGVTPVAIDPHDSDGDGKTHSFANYLFTVSGQLAPTAITPLSVGGATYSRNAAGTTLYVMAQSAPTATVTVNDLTPTAEPMTPDGAGNFFLGLPITGDPPATLRVRAVNSPSAGPSTPNEQAGVVVTDLVTITQAKATCNPTTKTCDLLVQAQSSDTVGPAALTLGHTGQPLTGGTITISSAVAVPAAVTVTSSKGGVAVKPVTILNVAPVVAP